MTDFLIRSIQFDDLDDVLALAKIAGDGMTSLPTKSRNLEAKIEASCATFNNHEIERTAQQFFLVLEDLKEQKIVGTCCIYVSVRHEGQPFHSYKINYERIYSQTLKREFIRDYLTLDENREPASVIGSLFLHPDYRGKGLAKWLSRIRYVLMKAKEDVLEDTVLSEIRGYIDQDGNSPYWNSFGKKYFGMSFPKAEKWIRKKGYQFVYELMPKEPIPLFLLPEEAWEYIGKPHDLSVPAMKMLLSEGFDYNDTIDFFDGGPQFSVKMKNIHTFTRTHKIYFQELKDKKIRKNAMIAYNTKTDFKSVLLSKEVSDGSLDKVMKTLGLTDPLETVYFCE